MFAFLYLFDRMQSFLTETVVHTLFKLFCMAVPYRILFLNHGLLEGYTYMLCKANFHERLVSDNE